METIKIKETISDVENKKFSDFSAKVKTSLEDKLRNNPTIRAKEDELKNLQHMKDTFAQIKSKEVVITPEVSTEDIAPEVSTEDIAPEVSTEDIAPEVSTED